MNRNSLRDLLDVEGVDRQAYRLDGARADEVLTLSVVPNGWQVTFRERGHDDTFGDYSTEDEACHRMSELLLNDFGNRWVLVAGPADARAADSQLADWLSSVGLSRSDLSSSDLRTDDVPWTSEESHRRHWVLRTRSRSLPATVLADDIATKVLALPEFRMGIHRVTLKLNDGTVVRDVLVSGSRVNLVLGYDTIPFSSNDIAYVVGPSFW